MIEATVSFVSVIPAPQCVGEIAARGNANVEKLDIPVLANVSSDGSCESFEDFILVAGHDFVVNLDACSSAHCVAFTVKETTKTEHLGVLLVSERLYLYYTDT